jgi:hypothetical protein
MLILEFMCLQSLKMYFLGLKQRSKHQNGLIFDINSLNINNIVWSDPY